MTSRALAERLFKGRSPALSAVGQLSQLASLRGDQGTVRLMVFLRSPFSPRPAAGSGPWPGALARAADGRLRSLGGGCAMESRDFLAPWEPSWPHDDLTRSAFRSRIKRYMRDIEDDLAYPFFMFRAEDQALLGALTLVQCPARCRPDGLVAATGSAGASRARAT